MRILVTPERLREAARLLDNTMAAWQDQNTALARQYSGLDWEARQKLQVGSQVEQAARLVQNLSQRAHELASSLESSATRFEQADNAYTSATDRLSGVGASIWLQGLPSLSEPLQLTTRKLPTWRNLSTALGTPLNGVTPVSVSGGKGVAGVAVLASIPWLGQPVQSLADKVWNWIHGYGWRDNASLISPVPDDPTGTANTNAQTPAPASAQPSASTAASSTTSQQGQASTQPVASSAAPTPAVSVPTLSQQGLQYQGKTTQYGCTATSASMVLEYWHAKDPRAGTLTPQQIVDANAKQGTFTSKGLSISNVHDEIQGLGYSTVEDKVNSDFEALKSDVQQGPVVAIVKLGMSKTGYNHAVVVTGIAEDGSVTINDPWDGQSHTYTAEKFKSSWGADFGQGLKNMYTVIRP